MVTEVCDTSAMSVISHLTLDKWSSVATDQYHILPGLVQKTNQIVNHHQQNDICEDVYLSPELVTSFSSHPRFVDRELRVIVSLHSGLHIARTFTEANAVVTFLILNEKEPGHIVFEFEWDCTSFAIGMTPQFFICKVSIDGRFVILVGPSEGGDLGFNIPTTKLLDCKIWKLKVLKFVDQRENIPVWPANMEFNLQHQQSHRVSMIVTSSNRYNPTPYKEPCIGALLQYDAVNDTCRYAQEQSISSALLEYIKAGQQLVVLHRPDRSERERVVYIYNTDTLEVVLQVDFNHLETRCHWRWALTHILPISSVCYRYLSLVLWSCDFDNCLDTDVITVELPYVGDRVFSLQHHCRRTIHYHMGTATLGNLHLPKKLQDFINGTTPDTRFPP